ncbi:hypothetical protein R3P38DRAFT_3164730 [Favolaschia claudopus]|uniref:Protein kinase domain-containing protein n=1 Tax=Favolaschia claudopus TaxID=2862362 RepID=A0AAW0EDM1_9AGAR
MIKSEQILRTTLCYVFSPNLFEARAKTLPNCFQNAQQDNGSPSQYLSGTMGATESKSGNGRLFTKVVRIWQWSFKPAKRSRYKSRGIEPSHPNGLPTSPTLPTRLTISMSLTMVWHGQTHHLTPRMDVVGRGVAHHSLVWEERLVRAVHVMRNQQTDEKLVLKIARDAGAIAALELEASHYTTRLQHIQGKYVPKFYGIYHGTIADTPVACMLLEYCEHDGKTLSLGEMSRRVMLAVIAVHQAGLQHCDLENYLHIILTGSGVRIVDFSCAVLHNCEGGTPTLWPGMGAPDTPGCPELNWVENRYGLCSSDPIPSAPAPAVVPSWPTGLQVLARRIRG